MKLEADISIYNFRLFFFCVLVMVIKSRIPISIKFKAHYTFCLDRISSLFSCPLGIRHFMLYLLDHKCIHLLYSSQYSLKWVELIHLKQNLCQFSSYWDHFNKFKKGNYKQTITDLLESITIMACLVMQSHDYRLNSKRRYRQPVPFSTQ